MRTLLAATLLCATALPARAGQAPGPATALEIPISSQDRFYTSDQFSNTVSVIDPSRNALVGVIKLGDPTPMNVSPLYKGQLLGAVCPDVAATPDGRQVWMALKDVGRTQVFNARAPFEVIKTLDTGPITNHVNIVRNARGQFAYVTVGALNLVKVFRTDTFEQVAAIPVGALPHGLWPSGDGAGIYVGLENADTVAVIDTLSNKRVATVPIDPGQVQVPPAAAGGLQPKQVGAAVRVQR